MRVDTSPFDDPRVRQALRLIVDRQQMIDQTLSGFGEIGNDLYAPFDPAYAGKEFPQRQQDIEQAKSLLKAAGRSDLQVELFTGDDIGSVAPAAASLFVQQAKLAGVEVKVTKKNPFYGDDYLSYPFAQDFWNTRQYLPQVAVGSLPSGSFNETHFDDKTFQKLISDASRELDEAKRYDSAQGRAEDRVRRGRLHHLGLPAPARRLLDEDPGAEAQPLPPAGLVQVPERLGLTVAMDTRPARPGGRHP